MILVRRVLAFRFSSALDSTATCVHITRVKPILQRRLGRQPEYLITAV